MMLKSGFLIISSLLILISSCSIDRSSECEFWLDNESSKIINLNFAARYTNRTSGYTIKNEIIFPGEYIQIHYTWGCFLINAEDCFTFTDSISHFKYITIKPTDIIDEGDSLIDIKPREYWSFTTKDNGWIGIYTITVDDSFFFNKFKD